MVGNVGGLGKEKGIMTWGLMRGLSVRRGDMVGRAGRCGGGWSVGRGQREQKGDQVGERQRGPGEGARVV